MSIKRNAAKCENCGDVVESKHRHDWVACSCWSDNSFGEDGGRLHGIFVDGGYDYTRHGWSNIDEYKDLSEYEE